MSVLDFVKKFKSKAYLFRNNLIRKWQYFIPICEYDDIIVDNEFDQDLPTVVIGNKKIICSIKQLIGKSFIEGDPHIFIVPVMFDTRPNLDVVTLDSEEPHEMEDGPIDPADITF